MGAGLVRFLYENWFRVSAYDTHHIPTEGPAILAANHSGTLPFDAVMIWADVLHQTEPPRVARPVLDHFVPRLPWVGTLFARVGAVGGSRQNFEHLLNSQELVLVFPEGTGGVGKSFSRRYQLQTWYPGHCELALRHRAPIVPVALIGAEEQMPHVARLRWGARQTGIPYLPLPLPWPLPVHYHIYYGAPIDLASELEGARPEAPDVLEHATRRVKAAVQELIQRGLKDRKGIFA